MGNHQYEDATLTVLQSYDLGAPRISRGGPEKFPQLPRESSNASSDQDTVANHGFGSGDENRGDRRWGGKHGGQWNGVITWSDGNHFHFERQHEKPAHTHRAGKLLCSAPQARSFRFADWNAQHESFSLGWRLGVVWEAASTLVGNEYRFK